MTVRAVVLACNRVGGPFGQKGLGGSGIRTAPHVRSYAGLMAVALERERLVHKMAGMVQVLTSGIEALAGHPVRSEHDAIVAECLEAATRLRADFDRFRALCRVAD